MYFLLHDPPADYPRTPQIQPPSAHHHFFFIPILESPFSNQAVLRFLSEWCSSVQAPPTIVDWQNRLTLDPPWVNRHQSTIVSTPVQGKTRCVQLSDWDVLLLDVIMNIAFILYSRHLSRWSRFEGNAPIPICLNASMFARIICDPASSTENVCIRFFLWIFANCLS